VQVGQEGEGALLSKDQYFVYVYSLCCLLQATARSAPDREREINSLVCCLLFNIFETVFVKCIDILTDSI